jgi:hypothetical protein
LHGLTTRAPEVGARLSRVYHVLARAAASPCCSQPDEISMHHDTPSSSIPLHNAPLRPSLRLPLPAATCAAERLTGRPWATDMLRLHYFYTTNKVPSLQVAMFNHLPLHNSGAAREAHSPRDLGSRCSPAMHVGSAEGGPPAWTGFAGLHEHAGTRLAPRCRTRWEGTWTLTRNKSRRRRARH